MNVKIATIGVGYIGRHHARLLASMPGAELVGVVDADAGRAAAVAAEFGVPFFPSLEALPDDTRAATIAVPTCCHRFVALACLARGWDLMVEKPLAVSVSEGREIVEAAQRAGSILQVGHTERYNPAVRAALPRITRPGFFEAHRLGTFSARSVDVDVIFDLMIHDLDLVRSLDPTPVTSIAAVGVKALTDKTDIANARIRFESGCVANLTASRISSDPVRKIRVFQRDSYLSMDTFRQEVVHYRLDRERGAEPKIVREPLTVKNEEPLLVELASFVEVVSARTRPLVTGHDGLEALDLAERIRRALEEGGS